MRGAPSRRTSKAYAVDRRERLTTPRCSARRVIPRYPGAGGPVEGSSRSSEASDSTRERRDQGERSPRTGRLVSRTHANPLTARVMVNRIWQHHFGRGLVGTPNDFGARGTLARLNLELLDHLAARFVQ